MYGYCAWNDCCKGRYGKRALANHCCPQCHSINYCSLDCRQKDYHRHRHHCNTLCGKDHHKNKHSHGYHQHHHQKLACGCFYGNCHHQHGIQHDGYSTDNYNGQHHHDHHGHTHGSGYNHWHYGDHFCTRCYKAKNCCCCIAVVKKRKVNGCTYVKKY